MLAVNRDKMQPQTELVQAQQSTMDAQATVEEQLAEVQHKLKETRHEVFKALNKLGIGSAAHIRLADESGWWDFPEASPAEYRCRITRMYLAGMDSDSWTFDFNASARGS